MRRNTLVVMIVLFFSLNLFCLAAAETQPPKDARKHTEAGKYVTSSEAYEMWKVNPDGIKSADLDTRP